MPLAIRMLVPLFMVVLAGEAFAAQIAPSETAPATTETVVVAEPQSATSTAAPSELSNYDVRNQFTKLLETHPYNLATVLVLDPRLLTNEEFLQAYPDIAAFVAAHPEVLRNGSFYLGDFAHRGSRPGGALDGVLEGLTVVAVLSVIAFAFAWLVRTIIDQKRWNRLSRAQSEVHNKMIDRFSSSDELLQYIKSPAGTKFLESAPIPLRSEQPSANAPLGRVLWSIQLGVVLAVLGFGLFLVGMTAGVDYEALLGMGAISLSLGVGFIASAVVSLMVSRRLGLWRGSASTPDADTGLIR